MGRLCLVGLRRRFAASATAERPTSSLVCWIADLRGPMAATPGRPSKACCAGVATVVTQSPVCICQSLDEASNLGIALNITRVVGLPVACSVRAPKVHCDATPPPSTSVELSPAPAADGAPDEAPPSDAPKLTSLPLVLACSLLWLYLLV
ncbi:hypothetical protein C4D60_Mb02t09200 [Musa balbisiana]|uniref:Bifunctional inhibitor/plant lipid transfer protein/seed storage helical domain-containing protein n=1 Tax=Musa balbisiana TaxID=52838 RepID=A0A4S8I9K7_MUSBA|nr:hypothetical protein C4D60_Mb02t09200 [Musa balbisiana]